MSITPHNTADLGIIVVAAGSGERLDAGMPKAFTELNGRPLIEYAIRTITTLSEPGQLVLVVPADYAARTLELVASIRIPAHWTVSIAHGGRERHESVRFGIDAVHDSIRTLLVHDAARPLTPQLVFTHVIEAVRKTGDSVIPSLPIADTLKRHTAEGVVLETVPRSELVAAQTPQGFPRETLAAAHADNAHVESGEPPTDDAELVRRAGGTIRLVVGSPYSHKITVAADVHMLEGLIAGGES